MKCMHQGVIKFRKWFILKYLNKFSMNNNVPWEITCAYVYDLVSNYMEIAKYATFELKGLLVYLRT